MLKLVINSPKGGVGKTTVATNTALLLASRGFKVLALDLAGGLRMSKYIRQKQTEDSSKYTSIEIREAEYGELPKGSIEGARTKDIIVADTDDYYQILKDLVESDRKGWRAIAPICPDDFVGLERISEELSFVATKQMLVKRTTPIKILPNRCGRDNSIESDLNLIKNYLDNRGIARLMSKYYLKNSSCRWNPIFIEEDDVFCNQLINVLSEIGIGAN